MKIAVVTPRYAISGVPLAQWRFARALARAGHTVTLIIGRCDAHLQVPPIDDVAIEVLDKPNVRSMLVPLIRYLRRAKPAVIFSAEDHLNLVAQLAAILARSSVRISGSSRVTPFDTYSSRPFTKRWVLKQVARLLNWRADVLTCVSRDMVAQYAALFPRERRHHAYNIVDDAASRARLAEPAEHRWFDEEVPVVVAAGTLAPWKGFADLIDAMAILRDRDRAVRLIILGEGPLRAELTARIGRLSLADRIDLPGYATNPLPYYARAAAFALSSHVEGMPNVLIEAMMAGCTPVATDCPTGPAEVLKDGAFGYLVPVGDAAAMANGLEQAIDAPIDPDTLARAVEPFQERAVVERHFALLGMTQDA